MRLSSPLVEVDVRREGDVADFAEALVGLSGVVLRTVRPSLVKELTRSVVVSLGLVNGSENAFSIKQIGASFYEKSQRVTSILNSSPFQASKL